MNILPPLWHHLRHVIPVFCSMAILASVSAENSPTFQLNGDSKNNNQVSSGNMNYVGGNTRIGVGMDSDFQGQAEVSHIFQEDETGATSGEAWVGYKFKNDSDQGFKGGGVKLNRAWAGKNESGGIDRVHKVFGAYDQNEESDSKVTGGYGQETENSFWSGHVSKGLSDKRKTGVSKQGGNLFEKAYDFGVGGEVGTFIQDQNLRIRGGLDYEWGDDQAKNEDTPSQATLSAGVEKFFQDSPHSVAADISANRSEGGYQGKTNQDIRGKVTYRYDFGGAGVFRSDKQTRRIRVEVPGQATPPRYERKLVNKQSYKTIKHTTELKSDTLFAKNSAKINPKATDELQSIARRLNASVSKGNIRISGHTCALGSDSHNQILSEQRAAAVQNYFSSQGVNPSRMLVRGFGESLQKYPNGSCDDYKNRRVEIEYVTQQMKKQVVGRNEYKDVLVEQGRPGETKVVWKTEEISTTPTWVSRALHNPIRHKRTVNTYRTADTVQAVNDNVLFNGSNGLIDVLANDSPGLQLFSVTQPANGKVSILDGKVKYIPDTGFTGIDTFTYTAVNATGIKFTATVTVTVPVSQLPKPLDDIEITDSNKSIIIDVLANDTDPQQEALTIVSTTNPENGTVSIVNGKIQYIPNTDYVGLDNFTYTVKDPKGNSATATVKVTVKAVNVAPVAKDDVATTDKNKAIVIDVLENDSDADIKDVLSILSFTDPANGSVTKIDGKLQYQPNDNFSGEDTFTYTVTDSKGHDVTARVIVTVKNVNEAPIALDDLATTDENQAIVINVLSNDTDPDQDVLSVISFTDPSNGVVTDVNGGLQYMPNAGFSGIDAFTYTITDGKGHDVFATVEITINPVNKAPIALKDIVTTNENQPISIDVLNNDTDPDNDTLSIISYTDPSNGSVTEDNGKLIYTPNQNFSGSDRFIYTMTDSNGHEVSAAVEVTINNVNEAPTAIDDSTITKVDQSIDLNVLANDHDPDNDVLLITTITTPVNGGSVTDNGSGSLTYTPSGGYVGIDRFIYTITDNHGHQETAEVTITINANGGTPQLQNNWAAIQGDAPVTVRVLDNDSDPDGDTLSLVSVSTPSHGTAIINGDQVIYRAVDGYVGVDSFTYTATDGSNQATATVSVEVTVANSEPTPQSDSITTLQGQSILIDVLANDSDPDGDTVTIDSIDTDPNNGTAVIEGGQIRYTPNADFTGMEFFTYRVLDGQGLSSVAFVTVIVNEVNADPIISNVPDMMIPSGKVTDIDILQYASDSDGDLLNVAVADALSGSVIIQNNILSYTPEAGSTSDIIFFTISDGHGGEVTSQLNITIQ